MVKKHFVSMVFDYGCRKESCIAFDNIHITEKQKQVIRKAWGKVESALTRYGYLTDTRIIEIIESFYAEFIN